MVEGEAALSGADGRMKRAPSVRQCLGRRFAEGQFVALREVAHVPEAVAERGGLHGQSVAAGHQLDANGPQPLEAQIAVQAHAVHCVRRDLERAHGHAERGGEVVTVEWLEAEQRDDLVEMRDQLAVPVV